MLFANIPDYKSDPELETNGVDLSLGSGRFITIKRAGGANREYLSYFAERYSQYKDGDKVDAEAAKKEMSDIYAKTIIIGWKGLTDKDGNNIPYSFENAVTLLAEAPDIFELVYHQSNKQANFRYEELEEAGKK